MDFIILGKKPKKEKVEPMPTKEMEDIAPAEREQTDISSSLPSTSIETEVEEENRQEQTENASEQEDYGYCEKCGETLQVAWDKDKVYYVVCPVWLNENIELEEKKTHTRKLKDSE